MGDPDAAKDKYWLLQKTLYGLHCSPRHWYEKIDSILRSIGLTPNAHNPCLYTGFVRNPHNPSSSASSVPSSLGLYVDDFVYFSEDPEVESLFERLLWERVKVDFMGLVEWFLGIHFSWRMTSSRVDVHLNQTGFATNLAEQFCRDSWDATLTATPFLIVPGFLLTLLLLQPMMMILPHNFVGRRHIRLIGSIGWLATVTRPDLAPVHSFLLSFNYKPSSGHMSAALHVLHYSLDSRLWDTLHIVFYRRMLRLIRTSSHHFHLTCLLSLPTAMPVGALKLGLQFVMVLCFLYSNVGA